MILDMSYYQRRLQEGRCWYCGEAKLPNRRVCQKHLNEQAKQARERRTKLLAENKCVGCGGEKDQPKLRRCAKCREISSQSYHRRRPAKIRERICVTCGAGCDTLYSSCTKCLDKNISRDRSYNLNLFFEVLTHYGAACACCGEDEPAFLVVDHPANDGAAHRRHGDGTHMYRWLKREGWPSGFQILCYNCNSAKQRLKGPCPHVVRRLAAASDW